MELIHLDVFIDNTIQIKINILLSLGQPERMGSICSTKQIKKKTNIWDQFTVFIPSQSDQLIQTCVSKILKQVYILPLQNHNELYCPTR